MTETLVDKPRRAAQDDVGTALYAKREKIYPREVHGLFAALRTAGSLVLLGLFYLVCWIPWDGHQAVLFDLPARKFHIFGLALWPQDFIYLALLLILAALVLFFVTAVAGRVWCGYACPQTVYTELFLWVERRIEGNPSKQMRLDRAPWDGRKLLLKGAKHLVWLAFSLWTGLTFVGYFTPLRELLASVATFDTGPWEAFWILFYGFATYGNAGWLREQVCLYMCPYARFQSAMFDQDTMIVSYDPARGEPRGPRRRRRDPRALGLGDCTNCTLCVQACPTGIDIRDGLQYECIGCAACIDACDDVMAHMGYAKGLIRYTTENALAGKKVRVLRLRVALYALILLALLAGTVVSLVDRVPLRLDVIRDRNTLYRETAEGLVENVYVLKLINMDASAHDYTLAASGVAGLVLRKDHATITVPAGEVLDLPVRLQADPAALSARSTAVVFELAAQGRPDLQVREEARFLGPLPAR